MVFVLLKSWLVRPTDFDGEVLSFSTYVLQVVAKKKECFGSEVDPGALIRIFLTIKLCRCGTNRSPAGGNARWAGGYGTKGRRIPQGVWLWRLHLLVIFEAGEFTFWCFFQFLRVYDSGGTNWW